MDAYDRKLPEYADGSSRDRKKMITPLKTLCNCLRCPTHTDCAKKSEGNLVLRHGKELHVCISEIGAVSARYARSLPPNRTHKRDFFCLRGSEAEQGYLGLQENQNI
jgi:hypothetical protein